jgi:CheY-like chemotaxis protein
MLQNVSEKIRRCYHHAEQCARKAELVQDEALRVDYLRSEQRWLKLAQSYELEQRLTSFVHENRKRKRDADRAIRRATVKGPASATVLPGNDPKRIQSALIAVVDDDEYARSGLRDLIESFGYKVAAFASAEEYLASDMSDSTACLILDVYMSGMSGPNLQAHLIASGRCPPTIFATGRFEEHTRRRVIEAGAVGYLRKPCDEKALLDCLAKIIRTTA